MSILCGNCKHWGNKEEEKENEMFRTCQAVIHDNNGFTEGFRTDLKFRKAHKAVVLDGSGYFAALRTRDDFGCVLWEGK